MTGNRYIITTMYKPVHDFASGVSIYFSDVHDGSIAAGGGNPSLPEHEQNVANFLNKHKLAHLQRSKVFVTYLPENTYTHSERVTSENLGKAIKSDALWTTDSRSMITLPVADCVATVVYDPATHLLGVLHLGRHASVAGLIEAFAAQVGAEIGSDPSNWHVWMSPSLQKEHNRLEYFEPPFPEDWTSFQSLDADGVIHIDIPGHNRSRFEALGVRQENIYVSQHDTYGDERYFSHRAATELQKPERQGRMMVVACMTD